MIINLNQQNIWFTSDLHFCHSNIIKYCNRPYDNTYEMNKDILSIIKKHVKENDVLFNLGDIGMASPKLIIDLIDSLELNQIFVSGNHDRNGLINKLIEKYIVFKDKTILDVNYNSEKYKIYLSHKPEEFEYIDDPYTLFLYGHLHNKELEAKKYNQLNIGWDRFGRPIELKEIIKLIQNENR